MKKQKEFRFENARRIYLNETVKFKKAIEKNLRLKGSHVDFLQNH